LNEHIAINPDSASGKPRIAGHRITVQNIVIWHERMGKSAEEIAEEYDLSLAQVHAALAYYFDHRQEIDGSIDESRRFIEDLKRNHNSKLLLHSK
jgi:uncharacterized protein (DUF433 family)